ncbi:nuclear transport factor 2 family protein [Sphingomonas jatrophae]|uniref:SnoaL-like domain-containing protein n=1 Tax=Sphingomonas jatrophae TaxID=1166337 RepID=A0A1I6M1K3_9SPHN|nr:nuclear transport factor 2 family protein [Sphingomonas jatrophae]SFS09575.1 SnoaL-like domain-containing protein [Sphingomonas jatrophae]
MIDPLERLLAIEEIRQLKMRYFRCMDMKDWTGLRSIFCADGEFDARASLSLDGAGEEAAAESNDWVYRGGDTIVDFVQAAIGTRRTVHHGHGHEVELLSPDMARGVIAMEDQIWQDDALFLHGCGHYHETYRRDPDGWRILTSRLSRLHIELG